MTRRTGMWWIAVICTALCVHAADHLSAGEPILIDAEDLTIEGNTWKPMPFNFARNPEPPVGLKTLDGDSGGQGAAVKTVEIPRAGNYRLWVRFLDPASNGIRPTFCVQLSQKKVSKLDVTFGAAEKPGSKLYANTWMFVWDSAEAKLDQGQVELRLEKAEPIISNSRVIDCFVLSDDPEYQPKPNHFNPPLWVQVKMHDTPTPCVLHIFGSRAFAQFGSLPHCNIWKDGLKVEEFHPSLDAPANAARALTSNSESAWVNLGPILDAVNDNRIEFLAMKDYYVPLAHADYTLRLSRTPSERGVFKEFRRQGTGSGLRCTIDLSRLDQAKQDLDFTRAALRALEKLPKPAGKRPVRFPILTGCDVSSDLYAPEVCESEAKILSTLGVNGLHRYGGGYDLYAKHGITKVQPLAYFHHLARNFCYNDVDPQALATQMERTLKELPVQPDSAEVANYLLGDELGSVSFDHMAGCEKCTAGLRDFLRRQKLIPQDVGCNSWEAVVPIGFAKKRDNPRLFYQTAEYRAVIFSRSFRSASNEILQRSPRARTAETFPEDMTYEGSGMQFGADWFHAYRNQAFTYGWTENWLNWSASYQLLGYRTDFLRSAARPVGGKFGCYVIIVGRSPWEIAAMSSSAVGHGADALTYYNYGPYYANHCEPCSQVHALFPTLQQVNYAIGDIEEELLKSRPLAARTAILWSRTADIWSQLDPPLLLGGKERLYLYLMLRHLGYPVDFVCEDDVAEGRLKEYDTLFVTGVHLRRDLAAPIERWVEAGGHLYLSPQAGSLDEHNDSADLAAQLGVKRGEFAMHQTFEGVDYAMLPHLKSLGTVTLGGESAHMLCGTQSLSGDSSVKVRWQDQSGQPALVQRAVGKGTVSAAGFFLGMSYLQPAVSEQSPKYDFTTSDPLNPTFYSPTKYPSPILAALGQLLREAGTDPPVSSSEPMVEVSLLESDAATIAVLSNWSGRALKNVSIVLPKSLQNRPPRSVLGARTAVAVAQERPTVALDLGPFDVLVFPRQ